MNGIARNLLRVLALVYIAALWAGVLPVRVLGLSSLEVLYSAGRASISSLSLTPGDAVFTGSPSEWKVAAVCLSVTGVARGLRQNLYSNECPNRKGLRLRNPPFDVALQNLIRTRIELPISPTSPAAERLREVTDYFCHSSLEAHPRFEHLTLLVTNYLRSAWSGDTVRNPPIECTINCSLAIPGSPRRANCRHRGPVEKFNDDGGGR